MHISASFASVTFEQIAYANGLELGKRVASGAITASGVISIGSGYAKDRPFDGSLDAPG